MSQLNDDLIIFNSLIELERKVVGIKFLFDKNEYENFNANTTTRVMPYCTIVRNASKGECVKVNVHNIACHSAARALGLIEVDNDTISGRVHSKMGVYKDICISRSVAKDMVYCKHKIYGIAIQPLEKFENNPDVIIIITNPFNTMRIIQGNAYNNGQAKKIKMVGMQAICQECTSYPYEINDINISMMCSGTRHVAQWDKNEMGIGIPYNKFSNIVDGIKNTVNVMERNNEKKKIEEKLSKNNLKHLIKIQYNKNYYTGVYKKISSE